MLNSRSPAPAPPAIVGACWRPRSADKAVPRPSSAGTQVPAQVLLQLRAGPTPPRSLSVCRATLPIAPRREGDGRRRPGCRLRQGWAGTSRLGTPVGWARGSTAGGGLRSPPASHHHAALPGSCWHRDRVLRTWAFRLGSCSGELILG